MKTLKLIEQYKKIFLEQDAVEEVDVNVDVEADATDVADVPPPPQGITPEGEVYVAALLTNAFIYNPGVNDIKIASDKLQKYGRTEPRKVIDTIEEMLAISDEPVEQELEALDAQ